MCNLLILLSKRDLTVVFLSMYDFPSKNFLYFVSHQESNYACISFLPVVQFFLTGELKPRKSICTAEEKMWCRYTSSVNTLSLLKAHLIAFWWGKIVKSRGRQQW